MSEKTPEEVFEERERLFEIMARGRLSMRLPDSPWETILPEVQGAWMADMCAGVDALDAAGYVIVPKAPPPGWSDLAWGDLLLQLQCFPSRLPEVRRIAEADDGALEGDL